MTGSILDYTMRLVLALAIGGIVGLEREFHGKPAGVRTNILMCVGSCLIMIISIEIARSAARTADPGRIAAQVVTGVGFLCAGTIMRSRFSISGLTTAATIWVLSALGLAIGAGYTLIAAISAVLVTLTLIGVRYLEAMLNRMHSLHIIHITLENRDGTLGRVIQTFGSMDIKSEIHEVNMTRENWTATFEYNTSKENHLELLKEISRLEGVAAINEFM
jgi:putative Mg2+ transporter-C (MgtC) family protein